MMAEYYFLFGLAAVWMVFAVVQDLRSREVSNWLNFSLLTVALAYRGFYALIEAKPEFFLFGLLGFLMFFVLGFAFYYGRVFAGGDVKLLWALGAVLPIESYWGLFLVGFGFVFLVLLIGAVYSLIWGMFIVNRNWRIFSKEFNERFRKGWSLFIVSGVLGGLLGFVYGGLYGVFSGTLVFLIPGIYFYLRGLDKCMTVRLKAKDLQEGDWLEKRVKLKKGWIEKSVHGLSLKEIGKLKREGKKVWIKQGIPFTPAILISFLIGAYVYLKMF